MCVHYHTKLCKEIMTFVPFNRFILKFTIGRWACHPVPMTDGCASSDGGDRMWTYYRNGLIPLNKKKVSGVFLYSLIGIFVVKFLLTITVNMENCCIPP